MPGPSNVTTRIQSPTTTTKRDQITRPDSYKESETKEPTIYIIGGSRSKRLAAHARQRLLDPRTSYSVRAYNVAEVGNPVVNPVKETGMTWLAIMRACGVKEGDIIVIDALNISTWFDAGNPKPPLPEPHMLVPSTPPMSKNRKLQDAVRAIRAECGALMVNVMVVILPPHARFMGGPCSKDHMANWSSTMSPKIIMEALINVDRELTEVFESHSNAIYLSIKEISTAVEGRSIPVHQAWAQMTGKSNVYLNAMP